MSLIVDINPVPWEILEQVKARLLKNRAKKQRRQPEKSKELRRVMQVDNGILAKQRWEEPSFIGGGDTPYIAIVTGGHFGRRYVRLIYVSTNESYVLFNDIVTVAVKLNDVTVGSLENPGINNFVAYLFVWTENTETQNEIQSRINQLYSNVYEERESPSDYNGWVSAGTYLVNLTWKVILVNSSNLAEPNRGDRIKLELVPSSPMAWKSIGFGRANNIRIYSAFVDDDESLSSFTASTVLESTEGKILEFPDTLGEGFKYWPLGYAFND
jgi:hypothetical protein